MARTNWQYDEVVTETDFNGIGQEINDNAADIAELQEDLSPADPIPVTIPQGVSIVHAGRKSRFKDMKITGRTLVNLLGRDGNCEDVNRWVSYGNVSIATDSANKVYGNSSMKITINTGQTGGWMQHTVTWQANKYYIALAELKPVTAALMRLTVRGGSPTSTDITDTSKFSLAWLKYSVGPSAVASYIDVIVDNVTGTTGSQYGFADGVRIYEISLTEYNALDTMTAEQIAAMYPYVDDMKHVNAVYVENKGKNLLPPFSEWTSLQTTAVITSPYKLTLNKTADWQNSLTKVPVVPGRTYMYSASHNALIAVNIFDSSGTMIANAVGDSGSYTITAPINASHAEVFCSVDALPNGSYSWDMPMFCVSTTALPFEPQQPSYMYLPDCQLRSNEDGSVADQLYMNGYSKPRVVRRFREMVLDGSLAWTYGGADTPDVKNVYTPLANPIANTGVAIKYDDRPLTRVTYGVTGTAADQFANNDSTVVILISNADSGWGQDYTPTQEEIKAYFNGWKISSGGWNLYNDPSNTEQKFWTRRDKVGQDCNPPATVTTVPSSSSYAYPDWTPYRLIYQLAQSVDEPVNYEGELMLFDGPSQVEMGTGVVVREAANPYLSERVYHIADKRYATSITKNRVNRFLDNYKGSISDKRRWKRDNVDTFTFGNERTYTPEANYDNTAAYSVTYLVLDTYQLGIAPTSITGAVTPNIKETVDDTVQAITELRRDVSVSQNVKSDRQQPQWITATLLNGWVTEHSTLIPRYRVTTAGKLEFEGSMKSGIYSYGTLILKTPFKPKRNSRISVVCSVPSAVDIGAFVYDIDGNLVVEYLPSDGWVNLSGITINLD
ncbi:hypothetical protein [Paenibacillus ginsengarvi]|uniref:Uncharacterized protein n=1 Tax=Paenibacillus ginsengarvi TaxID=400777 RepID=A0A3B0CNM8_9BACL|nr:hypothetical protein [Paenibacillus ginsengarvi]RKN85859.1 hypothetical protein D7M11_05865 [Paenibacillus ginsengarvi]